MTPNEASDGAREIPCDCSPAAHSCSDRPCPIYQEVRFRAPGLDRVDFLVFRNHYVACV